MVDSEHWYSDTFAPIIELGKWIWGNIPKSISFSRPRFNFITIHYCYIVGMTILFSVMLYPYAGLAYIDALFFAGGTATQSGLNTVDVNTLTTYQQVIFMLGSCLCTPIFINTVVVFVRLYWFEKRFEHIVKEIRMQRRTRTLSRSRSQMRGEKDQDVSGLEGGVRNKTIELKRDTLVPGGMSHPTAKTKEQADKFKQEMGLIPSTTSVERAGNGSTSSDGSRMQDSGETGSSESTAAATETAIKKADGAETPPETPQSPFMGLNPRLGNRERNITFADEVPDEGDHSPELARVPDDPDLSKHIEFLQRQQERAKQGGAFYIPGPRDFDEGKVPEQLNHDQTMRRLHTRNSMTSHPDSRKSLETRRDTDSPERPRRGITIDEPEHPAHRVRTKNDEATTTSHAQENSGGGSLLHHRTRSGGFSLSDGPRGFAKTLTNLTNRTAHRNRDSQDQDPMPYFSWTATTGRNSAFLGLSAEQREELGGIEYRSLKTLAGILIFYYVGFHTLGMVVLLPWILHTQPWKGEVQGFGQSAAWWGVFTPASLFNDLGLTLTPNSMISFQEALLPLLFGSFLIVIGNTGFPCMLRFMIWVLSKIATHGSPLWEELRFLLDHPRRCFTLLFPSKATWWLFWVLIGLNGIDLIFFIILDLNTSEVTMLPTGYRVLNGWFQAVSTRTAGFSSVNLAGLQAAIQVSYLIMMYISVFPIAISVRRTNVYEEKSLGIFGGEEDAGDGEQSYVSQHLRRQLSFDLWYIFLGLFIIAIVEGDRLSNTNQYAFTTFSVLFEIVSAYGTVGLSLGYPGINASFSAEFRTLSKLIIVAMMIRGRHRGLPYALDRAILLPSEKLHEKEAEDADMRMQRRRSVFAEGEGDFTRSKTWEDGDLDESGLPKQNLGVVSSADAMTAGAGGEHNPEALHKMNTRRSTAMSSKSQNGIGKTHSRSRSLSRVIVGGLSAGPTFSKRD